MRCRGGGWVRRSFGLSIPHALGPGQGLVQVYGFRASGFGVEFLGERAF